ncbi:BTAD domain-containing putative transcriptional regulator [Streptomyces sp. NPDC050549]|uniref:AfsR/SARP family transcriptional regulator n=1 Tax=Streptomyces sp. NPDC050549 TaxID=3155406 RepID=UPI00343DAF41
MRFQVLGPVEVWRDHTQVLLGGPKLRTVLAALLLARGRVVSDATLTSLLWGELPPATCVAQIHTYMSRLRHLVGPQAAVIRQRPGYLLRMPLGASRETPSPELPITVDLLEFERLAALGREAGRKGDAAAASQLLRAALATWSGPVLGGVTESLAEGERPHLEETRLAVLEERIEADLALSRHADLVPELMGWAKAHPLRERLRGQLMTALYRCDRQADALSVFQEGRVALAEALGIDPGPTLRNLHQAILVGDPALAGPVQRSRAATRPAAPGPLPAAPADFTGRQAEVTELKELLTSPGHRTRPPAVGVVIGMPGVGKTTLALQVAGLVSARYPDGQLFVDVRGSRPDPLTADDITVEILRLLGVDEGDLSASADRRKELCRRRLLGRRTLIVLDDVADERQIRPLLPSIAGCGVLLTSRARLSALPGIRPVSLAPFTSAEAHALLQSIVGAERLAAWPKASRSLVESCARLPLAVRIVGSRLAARPQWPLNRMTRRLAEPHRRMDELRIADLALRDVFATSYERLSLAARRALRLLSLLSSPTFSTWTAALLLDLPLHDTDDLIDQLVDVHVVDLVHDNGGGQSVYTLNSLMRSYVVERARTDGNVEERRAALERLDRPAHTSFGAVDSTSVGDLVYRLRETNAVPCGR